MKYLKLKKTSPEERKKERKKEERKKKENERRNKSRLEREATNTKCFVVRKLRKYYLTHIQIHVCVFNKHPIHHSLQFLWLTVL